MSNKFTESLNPAHLAEIRQYVASLYTADLGDRGIAHTDLLRFFVRYLEAIHQKLIVSSILSHEDFRYALFGRFELAVATYYHSIRQTLTGFLDIIDDSIDLGYSEHFGILLAGAEREVQLRVAFVDRYFYAIDHFIQMMNRNFSFGSTANTKGKQQVFTEMLSRFKMEDRFFTPKKIFDIFLSFEEFSDPIMIEWLRNNSDRKIKYAEMYEYFANIRNSLHNNGFPNKNLNNLAIGKVVFEANKNSALRCLSITHLLVLLIPLTEILKEIVVKSISEKPELLTDPWRQALKDFVSKRQSAS